MITIDFNRVSKILICYFLIMCKWKFIKMRITVNPRQKCTICGQISLPRVSWKGTTLPINEKAVLVGGSRAWCGDLTFFQTLWSKTLPTGKSFNSNAQKIPSADKFYQGCYGQGKVREKGKLFKVREKSGNFSKSQGTLFSGAMHQGWQCAFNAKIKPLWTFSTWWSFPFWK